MTAEQTAQAQLQKQADETLARVREMCERAFQDGVRRGYEHGFRDGVVAMGPPNQQTPASDA